jgi:tetratricopeptide (TPR) repeat protein
MSTESKSDEAEILRRAHGFRQAGRLRESEACFREALAARPDPAVMNDLAIVLGMQEKLDEAIGVLAAAHRVDPTHLPVLKNLGLALGKKGRQEEALAVYAHAARIDPKDLEILDSLGATLGALGRYGEAMEVYRRALALNPEASGFKCRLARRLRMLEDSDTALRLAREVLAKEPENFEAWVEVGSAYRQMNRLEEALEAFDRALALRPEDFEAKGTRALILLTMGDFERGWREYEFRWKSPSFEDVARTFRMPRWDGRADLKGKRVLLFGEQGVGDIVQFARYIPMLADRGAAVSLECPVDLHALMGSVRGLNKISAKGASQPACDYEIPTMSLPLVFGTRVETIPGGVPYVAPPERLAAEWAGKMAEYGVGKKIGIAWAGSAKHTNDRRRSTALAAWAPVGRLGGSVDGGAGGATFFMMQKGPAAAQWMSAPMKLVNLTAGLSHFGDTAAMISQLDLVITVDTAVAHIAGAMGKRVWNLISYLPDFRWMLGREDTPWYPTMRLFRQSEQGDWSAPVGRIVEELKKLAR